MAKQLDDAIAEIERKAYKKDKKSSCFIKCEDKDCGTISFNDDDSVCPACGSKNTHRLLITDPILTMSQVESVQMIRDVFYD